VSTLGGQIPQILLSFNLIRIFEDKYGLMPIDRTGTSADILTRQVAWLKGNLSQIKINPYVYGLCPTGNKVNILIWLVDTNIWSGVINSNTAISPALTPYTLTTVNSKIDSDGFCYFLVYTDAAQTTNPNFIVMANHGLTVNDVVENSTRSNAASIITTIMTTTNVLILKTPITSQAPGDTINKYIYTGTDKTSEAGTTENSVVINNHGLTTGDYIKNVRLNQIRKIKVIDANTFSFDMPSSNPITGQVQETHLNYANTLQTRLLMQL
jgi:hypothetical protein